MSETTKTDITQPVSTIATDAPIARDLGDSAWNRQRLFHALGLAALLVPLAWLAQRTVPATGLDPSWILGINLAKQQGVEHGTEILFTYGPLGWLARPQAFDAATMWGYLVYVAALIAVLAITILYAMGSRYRWWIVVIATYALLASARGGFLSELVMLTAFALALLVLQQAITGRFAYWMPVMLGIAGGLQMMVKFGTGFVTVGIALMLAVFSSTSLRHGLMRTAATAAAVIGALLAGWVATGQSIAALDDYLLLSMELSTGYVEMAIERSEAVWEYVAAAALATAAVVAIWRAGPIAIPKLAKWGWVGLLAGMTWHMFRYGFIRHASHGLAFFWFIALTMLAIQWRPRARYVPLGIAAAALVVMTVIIDEPMTQMLDPTNNVRFFVSDARLALSSEARTEAMAANAAAARAHYATPDEILRALGDGSTHLDTFETTLAWAYDLDWNPAPAFQTYLAYTDTLDRRNADRLLASDGPRNVLRHSEGPVDGRYRLFETPQYNYAILCGFSSKVAADDWQVVERSPASRCGGPISLGVVEAGSGDLVAVPLPSTTDALVYAEIDVERTLPYSVSRHLFKPPTTTILLNGTPFRMVANHLSGPLVLAIPDWEELPMRVLGVDGTDVESIGVEGEGIHKIRIEFFEVPLTRETG